MLCLYLFLKEKVNLFFKSPSKSHVPIHIQIAIGKKVRSSGNQKAISKAEKKFIFCSKGFAD